MNDVELFNCLVTSQPLVNGVYRYAEIIATVVLLVVFVEAGQRLLCYLLGRRSREWFNEISSPAFIAHIVHGTWAPKAPWTQPGGSELLRRLQELGNCQLVAFDWSGVNSFHSRARATQQFEIHLRSALEKHPTAKHLIFAHSHGGGCPVRS